MLQIEELFRTVRESASSQSWSKGVQISRRGEVRQTSASSKEISLQVTAPGSELCQGVTLWPQEEDWNCDCHEEADPCQHVIGGTIFLRHALEEGRPLEMAPSDRGSIQYQFSRKGDLLHFQRNSIFQSHTEKLKTTLGAITSGRVQGPKLIITKIDLEIDVLLGPDFEGTLPSKKIIPVLKLLAKLEKPSPIKDHEEINNAEIVILDGKPIATSGEPRGIRVHIFDLGGGVKLEAKQDSSIQEIFKNGIVRCGNTLHPAPLPQLSPREQKLLTEGRFFGQKELVELISEILPALKEKVIIEIKAKNLPGSCLELPRLILDTRHDEHTLYVTGFVVYGDPEVARLEKGNLKVRGKNIPTRDYAEEKKLAYEFEKKFQKPLEETFAFSHEKAVLFLERLGKWNGDVEGRGFAYFKRSRYELVPQINIRYMDNNPYLDVSFASEKGDGKVSPETALKAWERKESMVPLIDGGWATLPLDWFKRFGPLLSQLLEARAPSGKMPTCLIPELEDLCSELDVHIPWDRKKLLALFPQDHSFENKKIPKEFLGSLRNYQESGVQWLLRLKEIGLGALLADDMGLGKTIQALCVLEAPCLIVAPTSVIFNWQKEIKRFRPDFSLCLYHGPQRQLDTNASIVLTSYALLRLDCEKLSKIQWNVVLLDEAQIIKNPESQGARAAFQLNKKFGLALSGTPIENRLEDIWSLFYFLNPGLLGTLKTFKEKYVQPIINNTPHALELLRKKLTPFVLRRKKDEVALELPPKTEVILSCELSSEEKNLYESIKLATRQDVIDQLSKGGNILQALELLLRLRQVACHSGLIPGHEHSLTSSKLKLLQEHLEQSILEGHRVLIFSQWTKLLDKVEGILKESNIAFGRIDGSTKNRMDIVDAFQTTNATPVLLLSLKAAGVGLNLTAADHVYILDPWWNPAVEDQAADRAHRIGQDKPVIVHKLIAKDTLEEKILELQEHKRHLSEITKDTHDASRMVTREDIMMLLQ